jgi:hypothetical protein
MTSAVTTQNEIMRPTEPRSLMHSSMRLYFAAERLVVVSRQRTQTHLPAQ